ncbi:O-antigen ligase family protein [Sphingobacterium haloxyli]|uniref:O-antigen ligase-related domain-containing protein n=1 Tax=Sphingobacterium haloxyli TaxID=2100533 RepID=A0A2S9J241_9SPHI|nr:O-antigen ligase family protein [Sphingobacterium haloxyli]PRD46851.1 hypothetical protein C5745_13375 [Sphingobacterium haloxyli]
MVFLIIGAMLIVYSRFDFKKSFLIFLTYKFFLVTNITVISVPGIPLLTLDLFLTLYYVVVFLYKKQNKMRLLQKFPYRIPFIALAISWFLSTIFSISGFSSAVSEFVKELFTQLLLIWVMWEIVRRKSDWVFLFNSITVCIFITCLYGYYEKVTQSNPLVAYEMTLVDDSSRAIDFTYDEEIGRGFRAQSVFEHAIGAGINWALYVLFVFTLYFRYRLNLVNWFSLLVAVMCIPCILFTNSRAPLVFLGIGSLAYINFKNKKFIISVFVIMIGLAVGSSLFEEYSANILSIFDSSYQKEVGGSNSDMRLEQLAAALAVMERSPILGLGYKFSRLLENDIHVSALLGLESIWFKVLTQFGIVGILSYTIYAAYSMVIIPKRYNSFPVFIISLAYWITASLTSTPGMLFHFFFIVILFFIRFSISQSKKGLIYVSQA